MSQIRMQNHFGAVRSEERYSVDADLLREIRQVRATFTSAVSQSVSLLCVFVCLINTHLVFPQHLKQQQEGLGHLISVIKDDMEDIKLIEHGLHDNVHTRGGMLS